MDSTSFKRSQRSGLYKEQKKIWENAISNRELRLKELRSERDSLLSKAKMSVQNDARSKNATLVSFYNTLIMAGFEFKFNKFYAMCVILLTILVTLILEFIIWSVFGILGAIYEDVLNYKIGSFVEMQKTLENAKINNFNDDAKSINIINKVKNSVNENISKAKSLVNAVENDN